jgi:flagellar basal body-associated protein FliL
MTAYKENNKLDDLRSGHRPSHPTPTSNTIPQGGKKPTRRNTRLFSWIIAISLIVLALVAVGVISYRVWSAKSITSEIKKDKFQAVFLTNGQVYFGKIDQIIGNYVRLHEIYYLQVQQTVQPKDNTKTSTENQNQQLSLAKLGGELHGPEDTMYIDRAQILFWENLKDDGKVVQAIKSQR